jgi:tetratricopeptide (TPR) repeat protein
LSSRTIKKTESKKQDLDPTRDEFITKTSSVFDWAYDHRRPLGLLIILALLAAVGGIVFSHFSEKKRAEESALVSSGLEASFALLKPPASEEPAADKDKNDKNDKDDELTFATADARAKEALARWAKLADAGDSKFKDIGLLEKGAAELDLGEYEKAKQSYEQFLAGSEKMPAWLKAQAMEGLGYALEAMNKVDEAKADFEKWMAESEGQTKTVATYHVARLSQKKGDAETAKKLYKEVLAQYKDTKPSRYDMVFVQARTRLLSLDPSAQVPDLPAGDMGAFEGMDPRILQQLMQAQSGAGV